MPYFGFKTMLGKLAWALLALAAIMTIVSAIITAVYIERCGDDVETLQKTNPNDRAPLPQPAPPRLVCHNGVRWLCNTRPKLAPALALPCCDWR